MKKNILSIAKTAMKHFFDIDPVVTELFMIETAVKAQVISHGVKQALHHNAYQSKTRIVSLMHLNVAHNWNAA